MNAHDTRLPVVIAPGFPGGGDPAPGSGLPDPFPARVRMEEPA